MNWCETLLLNCFVVSCFVTAFILLPSWWNNTSWWGLSFQTLVQECGGLLTLQMPLTEATRIQDLYHLWRVPLGCSFVSGINYCLLFTFQTWTVESMPLKHWKKFCKDDLAHIGAYPVNIFSPVSPFWLNSLKVTALIITTVFQRESIVLSWSQNRPPSHSSHRLCSHII